MWSALSISRSKHKRVTEADSASENLQWRHIYLASVERFWNDWKTTRRLSSNDACCLLCSFLTCRLRYLSLIQTRSCVLSAAVVTVARFLSCFWPQKKTFFDCWYRCVLIITIFVFDFLLSAVSSHAWPSGSAMGLLPHALELKVT